ncbi:hypothetical protein O6H91_02G080800 [Diphasiastrum complanatum]|uniref:Uncharacterized protein n=1 Tax=Diphasiastrum complanatum TaxID=34168 RepID=A0ACC2EHJ4_DIPCM|nr:hypothetical protein O6H91_02G080800 [Diphasiastrum complanatum]
MGGCIGKHRYEYEKSKASAIVPNSPPRPATGIDTFVSLFTLGTNYDTIRIRMALQFKNVRVEAVMLSPDNLNSNKLASLEAFCPQSLYPLLQHERNNVRGSIQTILDYIDSTFAVPPLVKLGSTYESTIREWIPFIRDDFTSLVSEALYEINLHLQQDHETKLDAAFSWLDSGLAKHEYTKRMGSFPCYIPVKMDMSLLENDIIKNLGERPSPVIVNLTCLQHRSISCHLQSLVDLARNILEHKTEINGHTTGRTQMQLQLKMLWKGYCNTLELMQEHAQMEERFIFPLLEEAAKGIIETVFGAHAKELPVMNGIREDIKAVMSIDLSSSFSNEAMTSVVRRLQTLQIYTAEHFYEEEIKLLPLLIASSLGSKEQQDQVHTCVTIMESSHAHLLPYLLVGLQTYEIFLYLIMMQKNETVFPKMVQVILHAEDEFERVRRVLEDRLPLLQICKSAAILKDPL